MFNLLKSFGQARETGRNSCFTVTRVRMTPRSAMAARAGFHATTPSRRLHRRDARNASCTSRALPTTHGMVLGCRCVSHQELVRLNKLRGTAESAVTHYRHMKITTTWRATVSRIWIAHFAAGTPYWHSNTEVVPRVQIT